MMGLALDGEILVGGENLAIQGLQPLGMAVNGEVVWEAAQLITIDLFGSQVPQSGFPYGDYTVGFRFSSSAAGSIVSFRMYTPVQQTLLFSLWDTTINTIVSSATGSGSANTWIIAIPSTPIPIIAGRNYWVTFYAQTTSNTQWYETANYPWPVISGPLIATTGGYANGNVMPDTIDTRWFGNDIAFETKSQPPSSGWIPTNLPNLAAWYDAQDALTLSPPGSNTVNSWADKSGNGYNAVYFSGSVSVSNNAINGFPVIIATSSSYLQATIPAQTFAAGTTFYYVCMGISNSGAWLLSRMSNALPAAVIWGGSGANGLYVGNGVGAANVGSMFARPYASPTIIGGSVVPPTPARCTTWVNGTQQGTNTTVAQPYSDISTTLQMGPGSYGEAIACGPLADADRQKLEGYLAWKWGLQANLPLSHPFVIGPPDINGNPTPPWTPANLTNVVAWYDGQDSSQSYANGALISQWNDKSGNGYLALGGSAWPAFNTTGINGFPTIDFTQNLGSSLVATVPSGSFPTVIVIYMVVSNTNGAGLVTRAYGSNGAPIAWIGNGQVYLGRGNDSILESTQYGSWGQPTLFGGSWDGATYYEWINGSQALSTSTASGFYDDAASTLTLGNYSSWGGTGIMGEALCLSTAIGTTDRRRLEGYLAWKWGMQSNLPSSHPYASARPYAFVPP